MNKEDTKPSDIAVRCVADGKLNIMTNAIMKEWKQCNTCSYIICKECIEEFQEYKTISGSIICPGSSFRRKTHNMDLGEIKMEEILLIAKKKQIKPVTGLLIQKAFYQSSKIQTTIEDSLDETMIMLMDENINPNVSVKQEEWSNMGSVLVKRNRGKYLMWERLEGY
ncbi:hypothetical protein LCGC14_2525540 [marine sediment metagenome]|uniref:Uncharacterized protein n=1 Tax=marine sediment metagenome TaxID=412755 RepID=A0A0F9D6N2_9ZZZZ|nr:MAG: hypothetical protein HeimC3_51610 [Candidatus Heimdallarchaeota archaeon LC_3]